MAKFLIGVTTGIALVFVGFGIFFFALVRLREGPPTIASNSLLVLHLQGDVPEKAPVEIPFFTTSPTLTVTNVWEMLHSAAVDSRIKALVLEPEDLSSGWAKLEEFRGDVEQFRKSGKPVFAYLHTPSAREYYVASAADRIYLGPEDPLYLKGMRAEIMYYKKALDKLGVTVYVDHAGKYKDYGDQFTRSDMSPETREVMTSLVDNLYGNLVDHIAAGRKKTPDEVRALIDQGPFLATEAHKDGLVDELRFEDQMYGELKSKLNVGDLKRVTAETYVRVPEPASLQGRSRVALVVGEGDIIRGDPNNPAENENSLSSSTFDKLLEQVGNDSSIRAVIVRIDSPGGEVTASDDIWRQMNLLSKKKPMIISMSDVAASGGYYMALTGDPIVAYPGTETGSIGVLFGKPDIRGLFDKLGLTIDAVQRGTNADIDSYDTPLTPVEEQKLRQGVDASYVDFVSKVAEARHRKYDQIEAVAQGRVWLGSQAKPRGLVDELGGLDTAIALIKRRANIPSGENITLVTYPPRRSLFDLLLRRSQDDVLAAKLRPLLHGMPFRAWLRGGFLRMMPYTITVR
jgi:protease IV